MKKPWDMEVEATVAGPNKIAPENARTFVIMRWMYMGDLRPLADAILVGHEIDQGTLNMLAAMVFDDDTLPASLKEIAPYRLEAKRRFGKKGRPRAPENFARNFAMAEKYKALVVPGASDNTFEAIANEFRTSVSTVRHARTRYNK
jgi:hypothetical protein